MDKPPTSQAFKFYRVASQPLVGIQTMDIETGEPVTASALVCYLVKVYIDLPWHNIALRKGSRLFLTPATAAALVATGKIGKLWSEILIQHRAGFEAPEVSAWAPGKRTLEIPAAKPPRKARGSSAGFHPPGDDSQTKISRERIAKAGRSDRSGDQADARKAEPDASPRKR